MESKSVFFVAQVEMLTGTMGLGMSPIPRSEA